MGLLELATWIPVLPGERDGAEPPSNFERWSYVDELPDEVRSEHERSYGIALRDLGEILTVLGRDPFVIHRIDISQLLRVHLTRELHFGRGDTGHQVCFELHGQQTSLWCVAASVQMVLDFYRYEYSQERLARELGLGTPTHPSGLPYTNDGDVVTVLEAMTGNALDATMYKSNSFARFRSEIRSNRPLISFVPGHSRVVAGFSETWGEVLTEPTQGLLVYDPWPPGAGVVTRWENFASQVYRRTFTARVTLS
ncbi:C39 family peptidase [Rhodococcus sp. NPDC003383]